MWEENLSIFSLVKWKICELAESSNSSSEKLGGLGPVNKFNGSPVNKSSQIRSNNNFLWFDCLSIVITIHLKAIIVIFWNQFPSMYMMLLIN